MWWERRRGLGRPTGQPPLDHKPTAEDFTPRAVQRAVLQETLQHPATILPGALATVAALWNVAIDLSPASLMVMLGFGFVGAVAWVINWREPWKQHGVWNSGSGASVTRTREPMRSIS